MPVLDCLKENSTPLAMGLGLGTIFGLSTRQFLKWSKTVSACGGMVIAAVPLMVRSVVKHRKSQADQETPISFVSGEEIEPLLRQCTEHGSALGDAWKEICDQRHPLAQFSARWLVRDCNDRSRLKDTDPVLEFLPPVGAALSLTQGTLKQLKDKETVLNCLKYEYKLSSAPSYQELVHGFFNSSLFPDQWRVSRQATPHPQITVNNTENDRAAILAIATDRAGNPELRVSYYFPNHGLACTGGVPLQSIINENAIRLRGASVIKEALDPFLSDTG